MKQANYEKPKSPCSCINLRRASQAITQVYDEFLAPSGLKNSQYSLLTYIRQLQPVSVSDLAAAMRLDRTTIVRNLKPLEEGGYLLDAAAVGKRNRQLKLTDRGLEAQAAAFELWEKAQQAVEQHLGKEELTALTQLLAKIEALVP